MLWVIIVVWVLVNMVVLGSGLLFGSVSMVVLLMVYMLLVLVDRVCGFMGIYLDLLRFVDCVVVEGMCGGIMVSRLNGLDVLLLKCIVFVVLLM